MRAFSHREFDPDRVAFIIVIFDFGLGQRRALHHRPHHWLGAAIKLARHGKFQQFASNARLGVKRHGGIGIVEIAFDAQTLELFGLNPDPCLGKITAFLAEFVDRHFVLVLALGAILLLDLPLDRQAVTIPARHIVGIKTAHLERARDDVFQDLVERMADMDIAIGVRRAIVKHVKRAASRTFTQFFIKLHLLPALDQQRLFVRQASAHRKIRLRQIKGFGIVDFFGGLGHGHIASSARSMLAGRGFGQKRRARKKCNALKPGPSDNLFRLSRRPGQ